MDGTRIVHLFCWPRPSLFDSSRAPQSKHTAWVTARSARIDTNVLSKLEDSDRTVRDADSATGVVTRHVSFPADLERMACESLSVATSRAELWTSASSVRPT